ncbi:PREDICTED: uncharacterized protein LOC107345840 [Acropora digitifera]|uniref:uncharacterized protein LOC107345840 n=1 Tax=Acropora digitifera TaxID=70779 RepID=UPI00077A0BCA|nr:PREDICTED: uncharacterized protein LOC107345840 [Acropora digitifera]
MIIAIMTSRLKKRANAEKFRKWRRRPLSKQLFGASFSTHWSVKLCRFFVESCNYDLSLLRGIVIGYKNSRIVPGKTMISETSFVFFNVDICDILYIFLLWNNCVPFNQIQPLQFASYSLEIEILIVI